MDTATHDEAGNARATPLLLLQREGFAPVPCAALSDTQVTGRLWELLYALAARRIFLELTDHLDDRALYEAIEHWLENPAGVEMAWPTETNTQVDIEDICNGGETRGPIYLRYYADEAERTMWLEQGLVAELPPAERPPFPRAAFMPEPTVPLLPWEPPDTPADETDGDPLGLAEADEQIALEKRRTEVAASTGLEFTAGAECPPALEMTFLDQVEALEEAGFQEPATVLRSAGVDLVPPDKLDDALLTPRLWELLHQLSLRGFYVLSTNHLTDRELYAELWERGLREGAIFTGRNRQGGWFHDILGSGGDEDEQILLRFYYDDERRDCVAREWPKTVIPPRETPVARRDWRLPKGPFG